MKQLLVFWISTEYNGGLLRVVLTRLHPMGRRITVSCFFLSLLALGNGHLMPSSRSRQENMQGERQRNGKQKVGGIAFMGYHVRGGKAGRESVVVDE